MTLILVYANILLNGTQNRNPEQIFQEVIMNKDKSNVYSIIKAINILKIFNSDEIYFGISEISNNLKIPKSTTQRLVNALVEGGLLEQDKNTRKYKLGIELIILAGFALRNADVRKISLPYLYKLSAKWNETVDLDVLRGKYSVIIEQIPGQHILRTGGTFASRLPAHCTSTGKVMLAFKGEKYLRENFPDKLPAYTSNTIISQNDLLQELEKIRMNGYAISRGEHVDLVNAISVPLKDRTGRVDAAISLSGLSTRLNNEVMMEMLIDLKEVSIRISNQLGYVD